MDPHSVPKAIQILKWALISYCEESDHEECQRVEEAWETILDIIYPEESETYH